jgi:gamma-glutamyltranspeptidase
MGSIIVSNGLMRFGYGRIGLRMRGMRGAILDWAANVKNEENPMKCPSRLKFTIVLACTALLWACGGSGQDDAAARPLAAQAAAPSVVPDAVVVSLTLVDKQPKAHMEFRVTVRNGSVPQTGVTLTLVDTDTAKHGDVTIIDGQVIAGDLEAGATVTPQDTIALKVRHPRRFDPATLVWSITGTPVRVVTFDPARCQLQAGAPRSQTVGIAGTNMMVTSADVNASAAGCRVLARGGSAADAAIAVQAVLGVVEPFASGLAGGTVITYYDAATQKTRTFDGLSRAPANIGAATTTSIYQMAVPSDLLCRSGQSIGGNLSAQQGNVNISGRAVGVPGTLHVLDLVHRAYGRAAWNSLWDEAIGFANNGFPMTPYMYSTLYSDGTVFDDETGAPLNAGGSKAWWNNARDRWGAARCQYKDIKARYCDPADPKGERPLAVGTMITNAPLAATMQRVRDGGAAAFYDPAGPIATAILQRFQNDKVKADGSNNCTAILPSTYNPDGTTSAAIIPARIPSLMAASDFAAYSAVERKPLVADRFGMKIYTQPAPSFGGVAVLQQLGILERKNIGAQEWATPGFYYLAAEASRLSNADRRSVVGDPAHSNVNARVDALLAAPYLDARAALVNGTALGTITAGGPADGIPAYAATDPVNFAPLASRAVPREEDWNTTSSLAIVDGYGNALAMTTTINTHWGAHIEAAGMMLNNAMSNFSASMPGLDVNGYGASRRPRSSISPSIAFDPQGRLRLVWGSAGGGPIPDYIVKTFLGDVVFGMDIQAAINADNWTGQGAASSVAEFETGKPIAGLIPGMRTTYGYTTSTLGNTGLTSGLAGIAVGHDNNGFPVYRGAADYRRNGGGAGY